MVVDAILMNNAEDKFDAHVQMNTMDHDANLVSFLLVIFTFNCRLILVNRPKSCTPKNPCMNNGKCVTTSTGSQCLCQKGTSGTLCEKSKLNELSSSSFYNSKV